MKTLLILVGKTDDRRLAELVAHYTGRIAHYMPFDTAIVPEPKNTRSLTHDQQKAAEGEAILRLLAPGDSVVLLDERGAELTSTAFAQWLERKRAAARRLVIVVGGPYGFAPALYQRADEQLSLSRMTFSHQMVRLVIAEQLYRACTIIKGEPYHHE